MSIFASRMFNRTLRAAGVCLFALLAGHGAELAAQGTAEDYRRAAGLRALTQGKVYKAEVEPRWALDGGSFWYRNDLAGRRREFIYVDVEKGLRRPAFDHGKLAAALNQALADEKQQPPRPAMAADALPLEGLEFEAGGMVVKFTAAGKRWRWDGAASKLEAVNEKQAGANGAGKADADGAPRELPQMPVLPSTRDGAARVESSITFINKSKGEIGLFWMDPAGEPRAYGKAAPGASHAQHTYSGHVWLVRDKDGKLLGVYEAAGNPGKVTVDDSTRPAEGAERRRPNRGAGGGAGGGANAGAARTDGARAERSGPRSPDGKWRVVIKDFNVHLQGSEGGEAEPLTRDGDETNGYTAGIYWSADSSRLIAIQKKVIKERQVTLVESSPKDQGQPRVHTLNYAKPGDELATERVRLFDVKARKEIEIPGGLFDNPWDLSRKKWDESGREFTFLYNQRGHGVLRLIGIDAATGKARAIIEEKAATYIDYAAKMFLHEVKKTGEAIWMSERDGWNHLYLYDRATGKVKNQITQGPWVVRGVDRVDEEARQIWFRAGGIDPKQDPYYVHYCRIGFDGTGLVRLTEGDGTHSVKYSPDGRYLIDTYSRVDMPGVTELRRVADGKLICGLERGDMGELLKTGWKTPERFMAKGRDGRTEIYGVIYRPTNFDPGKKYPVIEQIYAGPQGSFVPKSFRSFHYPQEMAELGFITVQIDGMGTSNRSKAFHDVSWKNLADGGFPDRIAWLKAAAVREPAMDLSRVGVYGGSAGGQNALGALLGFGDFYKAAAADCGCHDNRMDKIWWNELYMGWPVGKHYEEQSNVTRAHKLKGALLLTVGELDRNVDPASTMQVAGALVKAGRDFDLLVVPGAGHGVGESPYAARRRKDFFVRELLGVRPPGRNGE